ncbi:hypothetical protein [Actinotalea sp. C106]|uniref:hypothetical protein n=1 Tax=Actinotalea sp. C106 TaxID=2908644 RepID=UPI0020285D4D|nr:hypothetical protein [Actinotalea sp. C106]
MRRTAAVLLGTASLLVSLAGVGAAIVLVTITAGLAQDLFGEDEQVAVVVEEPGEGGAEDPAEDPAPEEEPAPEEGAEEPTE